MFTDLKKFRELTRMERSKARMRKIVKITATPLSDSSSPPWYWLLLMLMLLLLKLSLLTASSRMFIFLLLLILKKRPWGCEIVFVCLFVNLFGAVVCTPQSLIFKKKLHISEKNPNFPKYAFKDEKKKKIYCVILRKVRERNFFVWIPIEFKKKNL